MSKSNKNERIAEKLIKIFGDGSINPFEWKHYIPMYLVGSTFSVLRNAKNFADGLDFHMELYDRQLPEEYIIGDYPTTSDLEPDRLFEFERDLRINNQRDII